MLYNYNSADKQITIYTEVIVASSLYRTLCFKFLYLIQKGNFTSVHHCHSVKLAAEETTYQNLVPFSLLLMSGTTHLTEYKM